jgi:cytochrome c peroxidase
MTLASLFALALTAAQPAQILAAYAAQAPGGATAERGRVFYAAQHVDTQGRTVSCATCHTADPRATGQTRAGKPVEPLAPAANPQRFTDEAKVEKWFGRNCGDVLGRACTAQEKADFIAYLLTIR